MRSTGHLYWRIHLLGRCLLLFLCFWRASSLVGSFTVTTAIIWNLKLWEFAND